MTTTQPSRHIDSDPKGDTMKSLIQRFEDAVKANGYRTCSDATQQEYEAAKKALEAAYRKLRDLLPPALPSFTNAAPASAAEPVGRLAQAYDWYRENYCMEPHKETRHGGDQVANAYALGMLHAQQGTRPSIEQQVESLQAQAKWAPKGSIT
jgi:hypothetical protein